MSKSALWPTQGGLQGSFHFLGFRAYILYGPQHLIAGSVLSTLMLIQGPNILQEKSFKIPSSFQI
jgi:hypothetical protein